MRRKGIFSLAGSGLGALFVYAVSLLLVVNLAFTAGVAAAGRLPGSPLRTSVYSVSPAARIGSGVLPALSPGDATSATSAAPEGGGPLLVAPEGAPAAALPAIPAAPVSVAGITPAATPTYTGATTVAALPHADVRAAVPTNLRFPATAHSR